MLDIVLQILSVIGIVLLILLGLVLVILLLVLFFPITYKFYGTKREEIAAHFKAKWLFGFFRIAYDYPEPSSVDVKILWHTIFQKKIPDSSAVSQPLQNEEEMHSTEQSDNLAADSASESSVPVENEELPIQVNEAEPVEENPVEENPKNKFLQKIEKIKYTIANIYDKIKDIWENITYYVELLKDEKTKALFQHVIKRIGKILGSIRPRHIKADIVFGTGSPDTTGYAYGVYGMFSNIFGPKCIVVPDFEQAIFEGELQFSGHITLFVLLINGLKVLIDPKLHLFIKRIKAGMYKTEKKI